MRILVIFSDPPGISRLRLDREDRIISTLARKHAADIHVERLHASEISDIHEILNEHSFDAIQFSGHGNPRGIVLDRTDMAEGGELVSAARLASLLSIPEHSPQLIILLCCYSGHQLEKLVEIAPFVITTDGAIPDETCLDFVRGFYERLFLGSAINNAFDHAIKSIESKGRDASPFALSRRCLIQSGGSKFVESRPLPGMDTVLVNVDAVADDAKRLGIGEEELCNLLAKKLTIHTWIFKIPRDHCVIPIGGTYFGEFSWSDSRDVVYCIRLFKLRTDTLALQWRLWMKLLVSYNDLASSDYRALSDPSSPAARRTLTQATLLLQHYVQRHLIPARDGIIELGIKEALPNLEFVIVHCDAAADQLELERYSHVVKSLEEALTNYHEVVDRLRPLEEER